MNDTLFFSISPEDGKLVCPPQKFDFLDATVYPENNSLPLVLMLPEGFRNDSRVHVQFRVQVTSEDSEVIERTKAAYSTVRFLHSDGETIDYGFQMHHWNRLNFDADVTIIDQRPAVLMTIQNAKDLRLDFTKPQIDTNTLPTNNLLGGATLLQQASARRLGMGYLITSRSGELVMIDGGRFSKGELKGDAEQLERLLLANGGHVSDWFLTHYHSDHIGAVIELLNRDNEIVIDNLYYDFSFDEDFLVKHEGGERKNIPDLAQAIKHSGKVQKIHSLKKGDRIPKDGLCIKVLNDAYLSSPSNPSNDSSVILKVETEGENILFLGDMGYYGTTLLQDESFAKEIRDCMIVQMAHHGQEGCEEIFYRALEGMKICLYPAQEWLFDCNDNGKGLGSGIWESLITRGWMRELDVRKTYNMIGGDVTIK